MIYNLSQGLGIPPRELLYEWSYENLLLMSRATPSYGKDDGGAERRRWDARLDANDPANFAPNPDSGDGDEEYVI